MTLVRYAVEGVTDEPVAEKLITHVGCIPMKTLTAGGKSSLDPKIPGYNRAAAHGSWLILRDLDHDEGAGCLPELLTELLGARRARGMCLRLAVRSVEAWLLADRVAFGTFFGVAGRRVPNDPAGLENPKLELVNMCRRSNMRSIRQGIVPREGSGRSVGPEYVALIREFAEQHWSIEEAVQSTPGLGRALSCLSRLSPALGNA